MARKAKRELGGKPVNEPERIAPVAAAIREFQQAAQSCPTHKPCNPLKYCPDRDGQS